MIKRRKMRWAGHVARVGKTRNAPRVLAGKPEERKQLERFSVDGRIILKCIFRKWDEEAWTGFVCLRIGTGGGLL
jgi:hypothetical protein